MPSEPSILHKPNRNKAKRINAYNGNKFSRLAANFLRKAADLIWPPRSLLSEQRVERQGTIETDLWAELPFNYGAICTCCGIPLEEAFAPDVLCGACIIEPPNFNSARAPLIYNDKSKPLILALKHAGRKDGLPLMANLMKESCPAIFEADLIIPVPMHYSRLFMRGFNQSAWLAQAIAKLCGVDWCPQTLVRKRRTPSQNGLSLAGRKRNVDGAFLVKRQIKNLRIILVDDVFTTGATVKACTRTLLRAGAKTVDIVTLLRVNRPQHVNIIDAPILDGLNG